MIFELRLGNRIERMLIENNALLYLQNCAEDKNNFGDKKQTPSIMIDNNELSNNI